MEIQLKIFFCSNTYSPCSKNIFSNKPQYVRLKPVVLYYFFQNCNDITMVDEKTHPILLVLALVSNILHTRAYRHSYTITLLTRARTRNIGFVFSSTIVMAHYFTSESNQSITHTSECNELLYFQ